MYTIIMGCGRVGRSLASTMVSAGHEVAVIDRSQEALDKLGENFPGIRVRGQGFDRQVLLEAGIERADCFAAVSSGDNTNIIAARVAREKFSVERVIARIYDARRAEIYERLGIPTVATVSWAADRLMNMLTNNAEASALHDPSAQVSIIDTVPHPGWVGYPLRDIEERCHGRVSFIMRAGKAAIPTWRTQLVDGDHLWISLLSREKDEALSILHSSPIESEG